MKSFFGKLDKETLWGGLFGLIAIIAIIAEVCLAGLSAESIVAAIKDIAGTIVAVMVFWIAAKHILKQIKETKNFEDKIQKALESWQQEHKNLVVRKIQYDFEKTNAPATCYSLGLKTNISDFYKNGGANNTGWFLRMPLLKKENYKNGNVHLRFHLNKGTFFEGIEMTPEDLSSGFTKLNNLFTSFIKSNYTDLVDVSGKGQDISVIVKKPIETSEDIELIISIINSMYGAYLVAANLK